MREPADDDVERSPDPKHDSPLVRWERRVAVGLLLIVVGTLAAQVIARYLFRSPIAWGEEVARLSLIWLTFVASGFVTADGDQIKVDLFSRRQSRRGRRRLDRVAAAIVLATCLLLLFGGLRFVYGVWPVGSPGIGVSMSLWYAAASFGLGLMAWHTAVALFREEPPS